jgi:hypothetical protein
MEKRYPHHRHGCILSNIDLYHPVDRCIVILSITSISLNQKLEEFVSHQACCGLLLGAAPFTFAGMDPIIFANPSVSPATIAQLFAGCRLGTTAGASMSPTTLPFSLSPNTSSDRAVRGEETTDGIVVRCSEWVDAVGLDSACGAAITGDGRIMGGREKGTWRTTGLPFSGVGFDSWP